MAAGCRLSALDQSLYVNGNVKEEKEGEKHEREHPRGSEQVQSVSFEKMRE